MTDDAPPPTRRQEIIARLMLCVEHPFGGFGQPKGEERDKLVEELLSIPGDGPPDPTAIKGTGRRWSADDDGAVRVLAFCNAPLDEVADMLKRPVKATYHRVASNLPGAKTPLAWTHLLQDLGDLAGEQW